MILYTLHLDIVFCAFVPFFTERCTCLHSSQDSRWKIRLLRDILKGSLKLTIHLAGSMSEDVIKGFLCSQCFSDGLYVLGAFQKSHVYWNYLKTCINYIFTQRNGKDSQKHGLSWPHMDATWALAGSLDVWQRLDIGCRFNKCSHVAQELNMIELVSIVLIVPLTLAEL